MTRPLITALLAAAIATSAAAQTPRQSLEIRYVRDSEEYATLARQVFRVATQAVGRAREAVPRGRAWAVVVDVDETALDNSAYQVERAAYGLPFDTASWNAFVARRQSGTVPGIVEFITAVRRTGGRVVWNSNREESTREDTRANLAAVGLWHDGDRLCLLSADPAYTKAARRAEVRRGSGACAWEGEPASVLAYVGDAMSDFPAAGEDDPDAGSDAAFGARYFILPNPLYGSWERRVTRMAR